MIKSNQKTLNLIHVILDGILVLVSFILAYYFRFKCPVTTRIIPPLTSYCLPLRWYFRPMILMVPAYLLIYYACNLYNPKRSRSRRLELLDLCRANIFGIAFFTMYITFMKVPDISRWFITYFFLINLTLSFSFRRILVMILRHFRKKGYNIKHIVIVGYSRSAEGYIDRILRNPEWGYQIHGILDDNKKPGETYRDIKVLGKIDNLFKILPKNKLDEIIITLSINEYQKLEHIVTFCEKSGVHTKFVPDYNNLIPTIPYIEDFNGLPVINIRHVPLSSPMNKFVKRAMDICGGTLALLIAAIPMLIVSIIIKATSKGPLIYSQVRVGLHNKEFKMYKFRSMEVQEESSEKKAWTVKNDPRVTPIGKFIRKTSIDELPQLFNVLKGDMSLVGPRPERPFFVEQFKEEVPRYMIKHQVRPGMTGWAQVNGLRGDTSIPKRIEHDLYYIENWSVGLDVKILVLTVFKGFVNPNAY
jgi:Undecaprenyl-phosphate glucose phosphotransferase